MLGFLRLTAVMGGILGGTIGFVGEVNNNTFGQTALQNAAQLSYGIVVGTGTGAALGGTFPVSMPALAAWHHYHTRTDPKDSVKQ